MTLGEDPFLINTETIGSTYFPDAIALSDGGFLVIWQAPDGDNAGIFGQRFTASGEKTGGELVVNAIPDGNQTDLKIALLANGDFLIVWLNTTNGEVYGRQYSSEGEPRSDEEFVISKSYADTLRRQRAIFRERTGTRKQLFRVLITTHGARKNQYYDELIDSQLTMDALFGD